MSTALAGFALGFAVAAGFGPISVLALTSGLRHGFAPRSASAWARRWSTAVVLGLRISRAETLTVLPLCVAAGTLTWFAGLAGAATVAGRRLGQRGLRAASVVAGVATGAFALLLVLRGAKEVIAG